MKYWIDKRGRISDVDETWTPFAIENGAPGLTPERVRGRFLDSFISDRTTAYLWNSILSNARRGAETDVTIRCDAPDRRRTFVLHVSSDRNADVLIESESVAEESREPVDLREGDHAETGTPLQICGWCKKVFLEPDRWLEVEDAVAELRLLSKSSPSDVTHGICDRCEARVRTQASPG